MAGNARAYPGDGERIDLTIGHCLCEGLGGFVAKRGNDREQVAFGSSHPGTIAQRSAESIE